MGTAAAAREMRRHYKDWILEFVPGFVESPARDAVLDQMKAMLIDPIFPVDAGFLCTLAFVASAPDATDKASVHALEMRFRDELTSVLKDKQGLGLVNK